MPERWTIEAPCRVFEDQASVNAAFKAGELDRDVVVVVRFQGPRANGMPELHKLTPALGVLQDRGYKVALVTDGRMSGASGKVPAAIHCTPEALGGGPLARCAMATWCGSAPKPARFRPRRSCHPHPGRGTARRHRHRARGIRHVPAGADEAEKGGSAMLAAAGL
jgi:phosphogluconate dehydratase